MAQPARLCPEKYEEEEAAEAKLRLAQWQVVAEVEQEMIAASRREILTARGEAGADPELADEVMRGLDLRSKRR